MDHIYDIVIIGGGPAGYTAALYAARAGLDTLLLERMSPGGQMALTGTIDNYPGFDEGVDGFTLGMKMQNGAQRFGAKTEYTEVVSVEFSKNIKTVNTQNGVYFSKTVIIATGADPRKLGIQNEQDFTGRGVHYCAHCDGRFYKDKTVVVVGGGNSAAADALYLSRLAKKVILVHRRDTLRAAKIHHKPLNSTDNIELIFDSTVSEIIAEKSVSGVIIKSTKDRHESRIDCDGVFVSIGRRPATDFLKDKLQLDEQGYIISDETTRTVVDGVFAAGDVRQKALRQIVTAVADGATAVHFAEEYLAN